MNSGFVVRRLDSLTELRRHAPNWDALWTRSETALPTVRAELVAQWYEHFAEPRAFSAFVVEHDGQWVAALPLVASRKWGQRFHYLPNNEWSPSGDLLLDPATDTAAACRALVAALRRNAGGILSLQSVPIQSVRWQTLITAVEQLQLGLIARPRFKIGLTQIGADWASYLQSRSRNHRRHINKSKSKAEREGATCLTRQLDLSSQSVEPLLRGCFEIEAGGWKGDAHSAVLRVPGIWEFYRRQAHQLAEWGQLSLTTLEHRDRTIAFEYGWRAKGVYASAKVGYDENFRQLTPGQLLRRLLFEQMHRDQDVQWFDFLGPLTPATLKWATHEYSIDRLDVALGGPIGRALVATFHRVSPRWYALRGTVTPTVNRATEPTPLTAAVESDESSCDVAVAVACP